MRAAGAAPDDVFGRALHAAGFIDAPVAMHRDAAETFVARQYVRCR
jgi:hypothetical protein